MPSLCVEVIPSTDPLMTQRPFLEAIAISADVGIPVEQVREDIVAEALRVRAGP